MHAPAIEPDADIVALEAGLDAAERDARALVEGLAEAAAGWRARPGSWSVAECLDHLATSNEVYLEAMRGVAADAAAHNRTRKGPARPGVIDGTPRPRSARTAPSVAGVAHPPGCRAGARWPALTTGANFCVHPVDLPVSRSTRI